MKSNFKYFLSLFVIQIFINPLYLLANQQIKGFDTGQNKKSKVVALTSLSADLVGNLSISSLVGIPGSSLFKNEKEFQNIPIVSRGRMQPDIEKIISLKPDFVIGAKGFHDKTLRKLEDLGISTISTNIKSFKDLESFESQLQNLLSTKKKGNLENNLKSCYLKIDSSRNNKNVLALVSLKPMLSPNSESWSGSLIKRFGFDNLTADLPSKGEFKGYLNINQEWLLKNQPNNLLLVKTPASSLDQYKSLTIWNKLSAVKNKKIFGFEYYGFINPGSLSSINKACKKLSNI